MALAHRLMLWHGGDLGIEPDDLVSTMVLVCLKRHRNWPEKMTLEKYLGMVMLSVLRHLRREEASRRQDADEAMDQRSGPSSHRDENRHHASHRGHEKAIGDDKALHDDVSAGARGRQARRDRRDSQAGPPHGSTPSGTS